MPKITKSKKINFKFLMIFMMAFSFCVPQVFADNDDDSYESEGTSYSDDSNADDDGYAEIDGWDGTENTSNSPNDDTDGWGGASYGWSEDDWPDSDDYKDSKEDDNICVAWDGENFYEFSYEDVYDEEGNLIFHSDDEVLETYVAGYFYDDMIEKTGATAESLAQHYSDAIAALAEAEKSGIAEEIAAAQAELDAAKEALETFCEHYEYTYEEAGIFITVYDKEHQEVARAGDPVVLATGKFVIDDIDISISNKKANFSLERHYFSNGTEFNVRGNVGKDYLLRTSGALGNLWSSILDTRIIRSCNSRFEEILGKLKSYKEKLSEAEILIENYAAEDSDCDSVLEEARQKISKNDSEIESFEKKSDLNQISRKFNSYVDYGNPGSFNGNLPLGLLIYVDENNKSILFEKSNSSEYENLDGFGGNEFSAGIYFPSSSLLKNRIFLEKFSETESESETSGENQKEEFCVTFLEKNEKRFYSSYGLPMRFEYGNGDSVIFKYDSDFRLLKIILDAFHYLDFSWNSADKNLLSSVSDGERKISFGYSGENLVSVTDFENDTRKFEYDADGFLTKQIKADGSFISFEYENLENSKVISSVTDEEDGTEYFSYDFGAKKTVYTNSDGEKTVYFYDDKFRTTRAESSDGSVENWTFDERGNRISWSNGTVFANYKYDESGKITEKSDEFGATETFSYSGNRLVAHKNKENVVENFSYDDKGRITEIYLSGELLKSFSYENGLLKKETDCRENSFLYSYDEKSNLTKVELLEKGKSPVLLEFYEYDRQNRVKKIAGRDGITRNLNYFDHKIVEESSNSVRITKIYSSRKLLLSEEAEDFLTGEKIKNEYEYDKKGRCVKVYVSGKVSDSDEINRFLLYEYSYSSDGKLTRKMIWNFSSAENAGKSGIEILYEYTADGNLSRFTRRKTKGNFCEKEKTIQIFSERNGIGNLVREISKNAEKSFRFDLRGNLLEKKIGGSIVFSKNYSESGNLIYEKNGMVVGRKYEYENGFFSSVSNENSVKTKVGKISCFADGKIMKAEDANGIANFYEYNGLGMLARISSPHKTTEYEYDFCGKLVSKKIKNAEKRIIYEETWAYSDSGREVFHKIGGKLVEKLVKNGFGMLKSRTDSVENQWSYSYDILGRKISEKNPYGKIKSYEWNENNLIEKISNPDKSFKKFSYDLDLNLLKIEDNAGILQENEYDDLGRIVSFLARPSSAPEKYEYDDFGRVVKVSKAGKTLLTNSYDDSKHQTVRKDAAGNASFWNFDGAENLISSKNRLGNSSKNEWNDDGKIKLSTDFNNVSAFYSYSDSNFENFVSYSTEENFFYQKDAAGNLLCAENENSSLSFEYDSAGNLVFQKNTKTGEEISFEYENGKIKKISGGERKILYEYGKCGEILKITDISKTENSNQISEISFEYDDCGREISRNWKTGEKMKIYYDSSGREILRAGFSASHGLVFAEGAVYDAKGFKTLVLEPDFTVKKYEYDELGRVKSVSYPYSEEKAEYLKSCVSGANLYVLDGSENFSYESLSLSEYSDLKNLCDLIGARSLAAGMKKSITEIFDYDLNSNLLRRTTPFGSISYIYDKNDRLVSFGNGCEIKYDANGNMILIKKAEKEIKMEYNAGNRLKKILITDFASDEKFSAEYEYDALGRRIKSLISGRGTMETSFIGKGQCEFLSKFTPVAVLLPNPSSKSRTGKMTSSARIRYKFSDDFNHSIDSYSASDLSSDSQVYFTAKSAPLFAENGEILNLSYENDSSLGECLSFMTGNSGTVKSSIDSNGLLSSFDYDEFGFPLLNGRESPYGFCGKKFDAKTESYNFGFRDYLPSFGRFSTEDPILDGRNWYSYCMGDYVNFFDLNGLDMVTTKEQYMQSMEGELLGNSKSEKANEQGCVVTTIAETLTALTGVAVDPSSINMDKSNFFGFDGNGNENYWGNIDWSKIEEHYGLEHTAVAVDNLKSISDSTSSFYGLSTQNASDVWNCDTQTAMSVANYIAGIMESSKETVVALQVVYGIVENIELLHFVVVNENVEMINGKSYINITPTSISDRYASTNKYRSAVGWIVKNGKTYVPVSNVRRIDTLSKNK